MFLFCALRCVHTVHWTVWTHLWHSLNIYFVIEPPQLTDLMICCQTFAHATSRFATLGYTSNLGWFLSSKNGQIEGFKNVHSLLVVVVAKMGCHMSKSLICEGTNEILKTGKVSSNYIVEWRQKLLNFLEKSIYKQSLMLSKFPNCCKLN